MYKWGDKLFYRNKFKCLFVKYYSDLKESALVLREGDSNVILSHVSDLKFLDKGNQ